MRGFTAGETTYLRSIALDASTVGSVTVTVAVPATREEEWKVLDSIYAEAERVGFRPFLDKANDVEYSTHIEFFESIASDAPVVVRATSHLGRDGSSPDRVEAVQSAILVSELADPDTLVLVDGGEQKARAFTRAIRGIAPEVPPTTHCVRAEQYFPTALLADICASHLAHQIVQSGDCAAVTPSAPEVKSAHGTKWGKAYSALFEIREEYERTPITTKRGRSVAERIRCWFEGHVAVGDGEYPLTDSLTPVVHFARERGFQRVAEQFSEI